MVGVIMFWIDLVDGIKLLWFKLIIKIVEEEGKNSLMSYENIELREKFEVIIMLLGKIEEIFLEFKKDWDNILYCVEVLEGDFVISIEKFRKM